MRRYIWQFFTQIAPDMYIFIHYFDYSPRFRCLLDQHALYYKYSVPHQSTRRKFFNPYTIVNFMTLWKKSNCDFMTFETLWTVCFLHLSNSNSHKLFDICHIVNLLFLWCPKWSQVFAQTRIFLAWQNFCTHKQFEPENEYK